MHTQSLGKKTVRRGGQSVRQERSHRNSLIKNRTCQRLLRHLWQAHMLHRTPPMTRIPLKMSKKRVSDDKPKPIFHRVPPFYWQISPDFDK
jgi:hypothetical protein